MNEVPAKITLDGAQRVCTPEETLERIRPFFGAAGITRVADITGLDRIGIPVALCIRPDSASLAVDSGKGLSVQAALASAAMEGMERVSAERAQFDVQRAVPHYPEYEHKFPLLQGARFSPAQEIDWVTCAELFTGSDVLVPKRCVGLDAFGKDSLAERAFYSTTNGLASGNTREEAVCNAIYEVIERDATCLTMLRPGPANVIGHDTVPYPSVQGLIAKITGAGCGVTIIDCTSDIAVPTFMAVLFDRDEPGVGIFRGYGSHLSPEIAMCRAVCEAAQARAVIVAGARDDITHQRYLNYLAMSETTDLSRWDLPPSVNYAHLQDASGETFREDIACLMRLLEAAGFARLLMYDFDAIEQTGAHVVRILIPGLEGYHTPWMQPGERARAAAATPAPA